MYRLTQTSLAIALVAVLGACAATSTALIERDDDGIIAVAPWSREADGRWRLASPEGERQKDLSAKDDGRGVWTIRLPDGATGAHLDAVEVAYGLWGRARWSLSPGSGYPPAPPIWVAEVDIAQEQTDIPGTKRVKHPIGVDVGSEFQLVYESLGGAYVGGIDNPNETRLSYNGKPVPVSPMMALELSNLGRADEQRAPATCESPAYTAACEALQQHWEDTCRKSFVMWEVSNGDGYPGHGLTRQIELYERITVASEAAHAFAAEHGACARSARACRVPTTVTSLCQGARERAAESFAFRLQSETHEMGSPERRLVLVKPGQPDALVSALAARRQRAAHVLRQLLVRFPWLAADAAPLDAIRARSEAVVAEQERVAGPTTCEAAGAGATDALRAGIQSRWALNNRDAPSDFHLDSHIVRVAGTPTFRIDDQRTQEGSVWACVRERGPGFEQCFEARHEIRRTRAPDGSWGVWWAGKAQELAPLSCQTLEP